MYLKRGYDCLENLVESSSTWSMNLSYPKGYALDMKKLLVSTVVLLAILSGCSTSEAEDLSPQNSVIDVVIDVRTPMEYADGHVEGSLNLDVESGTFESSLESLDKELTYLVYCRSGRRSAIAANLMRERGFEVFDLGSIQNMSDLGWPIGQ